MSTKVTADAAEPIKGTALLNGQAKVDVDAWMKGKQFGVLTAQAEEVHALSTKVTADAAEQIKSQMARGADGLAR